MKLMLDTSVLLAASGSWSGASAEIIRSASSNEWNLVATPYILTEVDANIDKLSKDAKERWQDLRLVLSIAPDILTLDRPTIFGPAKDRPILFIALAWTDVLLTLDRGDFGNLMGTTFYGLPILKPGMFLEQ